MFTYYPLITLLVTNEHDTVDRMVYLHDSWTVPQLSVRPPCYAYPRYNSTYPVL